MYAEREPAKDPARKPAAKAPKSNPALRSEAWHQELGKLFGTDFSSVRINPSSSEAQRLNAEAFTQGEQIHFRPGAYNPGSSDGKQLLGHELAHVVQQRQGRVQATRQYKGVGLNADPALEAEADAAGKAVASGQRASSRLTGATGTATGPVQRMAIFVHGFIISKGIHEAATMAGDETSAGLALSSLTNVPWFGLAGRQ